MRLIVEGMLEGRGERVRLRGDFKGGGAGGESSGLSASVIKSSRDSDLSGKFF